MTEILIKVEGISLKAELADTPTAKAVLKALPLEGNANVWGEEIYFGIPLELEQESDAREEVEVGTLAYWPAGPALCIFFGRTPVSTGDKPKAYSAVNVFGQISEDSTVLKKVPDGAKIQISVIE